MTGPEVTTLNELRSLADELTEKLHGLGESTASSIELANLDEVRRYATLALEGLGAPRTLVPGAPAPEVIEANRSQILSAYDDEMAEALQELFRASHGAVFDERGALAARPAEDLAPAAPLPASGGPMQVAVSLDASTAFDEAPEPEAGPADFSGHTDAVSVPELIGFFQLQAKSGVLRIEAPREAFSLTYINGDLCRVTSSNSPVGERLGELLVCLGHLTDERLQELMATNEPGMKIGELLQRDGGLPAEAISTALQLQVQGIFGRLCELEGARFTFHAGAGSDTATKRRYNVTHLLLETARRKDEDLHEQRQGLDLLEG
jgi:hypothetical protein